MSTGSSDQYPVYLGFWTNWSRGGSVMGATLTLTRQDSDLLVAFTAFFIAFIATRTWSIFRFAFHRHFSTSAPQTSAYHQRQAVLRNSSSPENSFAQLFQLLWASRSTKRRTRMVPAAVAATTAALLLISFTIAGSFSSRISSAVGDECYSQPKEMAGCSRFTMRRLPTTVDFNATCPFAEEICRKESSNILLDTGFLDTHEHFGLNAPPDKRVLLRKTLNCAPLKTKGYTKEKTLDFDNVTSYEYGNLPGLDFLFRANSLQYQYQRVLSEDLTLSQTNYEINVLNRTLDPSNSDFLPIKALFREDADACLYFLSGNGVVYGSPTSDEWCQTSPNPITDPTFGTEGPGTHQYYLPAEPAIPLGCIDQFQLCNTEFPGSSGCGPLGGLSDALAGATPFFNTTFSEFLAAVESGSAHTERLARLLYFATHFFAKLPASTMGVLNQLGPTALVSQRSLAGGYQGLLPSNQWQLDVNHIWDIYLAVQRAAHLDTAFHTAADSRQSSWQNFTSPALQKLCNSQKIRSTAYGSFSVFGLVFTFSIGLLIILTSYLLEPVPKCLYRKGYKQYAHLEWTTNGTLQLQRLVQEELNLATWSRCAEDIPVAGEDELLGCLNITDLEHPTLCAPKKENDQLPQAERPDDTSSTTAATDTAHATIPAENTSDPGSFTCESIHSTEIQSNEPPQSQPTDISTERLTTEGPEASMDHGPRFNKAKTKTLTFP
ncbi:hypothetical protein F4808DRAFT_451421 [Astrocystis sublimbata]|nr:hypothetical protein F4808DRAFT_451421 [Astrocystis sublimbata]